MSIRQTTASRRTDPGRSRCRGVGGARWPLRRFSRKHDEDRATLAGMPVRAARSAPRPDGGAARAAPTDAASVLRFQRLVGNRATTARLHERVEAASPSHQERRPDAAGMGPSVGDWLPGASRRAAPPPARRSNRKRRTRHRRSPPGSAFDRPLGRLPPWRCTSMGSRRARSSTASGTQRGLRSGGASRRSWQSRCHPAAPPAHSLAVAPRWSGSPAATRRRE